MLERRPVERDHLRALFRLEVHPAQSKFVAPNSITLAQVAYETGFGICGMAAIPWAGWR